MVGTHWELSRDLTSLLPGRENLGCASHGSLFSQHPTALKRDRSGKEPGRWQVGAGRCVPAVVGVRAGWLHCVSHISRVRLCDPMGCSPPDSCPWASPGKNTGVGFHSFLQQIFPTQGLKLSLLHCRQVFYHLSYLCEETKSQNNNNQP